MATIEEVLSGAQSRPVESEANAPVTQEQKPEETTAEANEPDAPMEAPQGESKERGANGEVISAVRKAEREKSAKRYTEQVAAFERQLAEQEQRWQSRFEQLVATLQPKPPQPDLEQTYWDSPVKTTETLVESRVKPVMQKLEEFEGRILSLQAEAAYGKDAIQQAYDRLAQLRAADPKRFQAEYAAIRSDENPVMAMVEWHMKDSFFSKYGKDPEASIEAEVSRRLEEKLKQVQPQSAPAMGAMPSNFATARNVGSRSGPAWAGPTPIADIFKR